MIVTLWFGFLALASLLVVLGVLVDERPLIFVGLLFLFILGTVLLGGSLEYKIGENVSLCDYEDSYVYGDNYTGYHWDYTTPPPVCTPNNLDCVKLFHVFRNYTASCYESTVNVYDNFTGTTSHTLGFFLTFISGTGMWLVFVDWKRLRG